MVFDRPTGLTFVGLVSFFVLFDSFDFSLTLLRLNCKTYLKKHADREGEIR
jgi:hypothetical protein